MRNLLVDQVEIGHQLGHAVLDLQPGVDLQEPEVAVWREQELGRRRVAQANGPRDPNAELVQGARCSRDSPGAGASSTSFWWRRWMEQSRSPRATIVARVVAQQLDLDVARVLDVALEVDAPSPKAAAASRAAPWTASLSSAASSTRRMPRPPPPAAALTSTG